MCKKENIQRDWYLFDARDKILGRLASSISRILTGKHKINYTPYLDCGDFVVVTNAKYIKFSGKKLEQKKIFKHSGYLGHAKFISLKELFEKHPEKVVYLAVSGMLPKNSFRKKMLKRLKIYPEQKHNHPVNFKNING